MAGAERDEAAGRLATELVELRASQVAALESAEASMREQVPMIYSVSTRTALGWS